jgi:DNA-binding GntR family transcriptional regulator
MPTHADRPVSPSERVYAALRSAVLAGRVGPGQALKPQELADAHGVSLAVVREALLRLVGEGIAERMPNRGFAVPAVGAQRWQQLAEARIVVEPAMLVMAIERGDVEWEARLRAAHHRLARTAVFGDGSHQVSDEWADAHHDFHRALLAGCGNPPLLDVFERMWTASELARRFSVARTPGRDTVREHRELEELALGRDGAAASAALTAHLGATVDALQGES